MHCCDIVLHCCDMVMHCCDMVTHCCDMVMQVATQAIAHMPTLLLFPLVPFVLEVALVFWWVFVAAYLYSSGMRIWSHPYL